MTTARIETRLSPTSQPPTNARPFATARRLSSRSVRAITCVGPTAMTMAAGTSSAITLPIPQAALHDTLSAGLQASRDASRPACAGADPLVLAQAEGQVRYTPHRLACFAAT